MLSDLHMHSDYSDGQNTPEEMIEAGIRLGYEAVAVTDHVWVTSDWVPAYAAHLDTLKARYAKEIRVYSGIEAKVLSLAGDMDAHPSFDPLVDVVLGSIHRIPKPGGFYSKADAGVVPKCEIAGHWLTAFFHMLDNPRVDIIAHPLSELRGFGITAADLPMEEVADRIAASGKLLELNVRYNVPEEPVIQLAVQRGVPLLISSDSHSVADLERNSALIRQYAKRGFRFADINDYVDARRRRLNRE